MLTPRHLALLVYIDHQLKETGRPPSFEEMKGAVKTVHMSDIYQAISALEKQGFISRRRGRTRAIEVLRLPDYSRGAPSAVHSDLVAHRPFHSGLFTAGDVPAAELPWGGRVAADLSMETPREAGALATTPGPHKPDGQPSRQALQLATELACELVGADVWTKLSVRTQANIVHSELQAMDPGRVAWPTVIRSPSYGQPTEVSEALTSGPFHLSDMRADTVALSAESARMRRMATDPPRKAGQDETKPGTPGPGDLPSLEALRIAKKALCRGYGLTEATRLPEIIVAHAIELSRLLVAYGLVPTNPEIALARPDPARELQRESPTSATIDRLSHTARHVLVVDDVSDVLVTAAAFLASAGFVVATASDGDAALRLIASDPLIGVLVTDFVMPGMSGADLIVQAVEARPNLKALLITGYPSADGIADLPPGVAVLTKPFRRAALIEQVSVLLGEKRPAHSVDVMEVARAKN